MSISPVNENMVRKYLLYNGWIETTQKGHAKFKYLDTGKVVTMSFHRSKGKPISEFDLRTIQRVMGFEKKEELVKEIRKGKGKRKKWN